VLTHSDWTPDNVLMSPDRAGLIGWASPTLGVGWTGPACWLLRLMASGGHTAHEAEQQASRLHRSPPRAHRPVRRSERPAVGRSRAVKHARLADHFLAVAPRPPPDSSSLTRTARFLGDETATRVPRPLAQVVSRLPRRFPYRHATRRGRRRPRHLVRWPVRLPGVRL